MSESTGGASHAAASSSSGSGGESASSSAASGGAGGSGGTAGSGGGGGAGGAVDKAAKCTDKFGSALTNAFGRLDGTVLAVVKPTDVQCPLPNDDHVVLEVVMNGEAYRMVINVQSTIGDPKVHFRDLDHALLSPAWADGWHTGIALDYVADLGMHSDATFMPYTLADLSNEIADEITIGQKVSVYSQSSGGSSAHEIHRNDGKVDGAIVLDPDTKPVWMLFHFADQTF